MWRRRCAGESGCCWAPPPRRWWCRRCSPRPQPPGCRSCGARGGSSCGCARRPASCRAAASNSTTTARFRRSRSWFLFCFVWVCFVLLCFYQRTQLGPNTMFVLWVKTFLSDSQNIPDNIKFTLPVSLSSSVSPAQNPEMRKADPSTPRLLDCQVCV